jgi:hypothetical protein
MCFLDRVQCSLRARRELLLLGSVVLCSTEVQRRCSLPFCGGSCSGSAGGCGGRGPEPGPPAQDVAFNPSAWMAEEPVVNGAAPGGSGAAAAAAPEEQDELWEQFVSVSEMVSRPWYGATRAAQQGVVSRPRSVGC